MPRLLTYQHYQHRAWQAVFCLMPIAVWYFTVLVLYSSTLPHRNQPCKANDLRVLRRAKPSSNPHWYDTLFSLSSLSKVISRSTILSRPHPSLQTSNVSPTMAAVGDAIVAPRYQLIQVLYISIQTTSSSTPKLPHSIPFQAVRNQSTYHENQALNYSSKLAYIVHYLAI